jgi:hypothetical protein
VDASSLNTFVIARFAMILASILCVSSVSAGPGRSQTECRFDFEKIGREIKTLDRQEEARMRAALREALFEGPPDPNENLYHEFGRSPGGLHTVNGFKITGAENYPLISIKKNLRLTEDYMHTLPSGAQVLSVGEGTSELAANLRLKFPNTKALDLWYDDPFLPNELAEFVKANRPHLIAGSAMKIPLPSRSLDLVVSHMLLGNLDPASRLKSLGEMIRILKVGGEARVAFADPAQVDIVKTLKQFYGDEITVSAERWDSDWNGMVNHHCQTLYIRRVRNGHVEK